ncbi:unnamed protein product [Lupinus luteus]|uniref:Uncharacterized protein n=1 Tax=Lupinus luteus TaxID=3873 RepID=A0AAV1WNH1_LUPLU
MDPMVLPFSMHPSDCDNINSNSKARVLGKSSSQEEDLMSRSTKKVKTHEDPMPPAIASHITSGGGEPTMGFQAVPKKVQSPKVLPLRLNDNATVESVIHGDSSNTPATSIPELHDDHNNEELFGP